MHLRTLQATDFDILLSGFNRAFSDYFLPIQYDAKVFNGKIKAEGVELERSVGAFKEEELVGFVLQAYTELDGKLCVYNAGTGVVPENRGKKLTRKMYELVRDEQQKRGVAQELLEVVCENHPAIHLYESLGFKQQRKVHCFKADALRLSANKQWDVETATMHDWDTWREFWSFTPTWQLYPATLDRSTAIQPLVVREEGQTLGYALCCPNTGRLWHLAVNPSCRRQGIGSALLAEVRKLSSRTLSCLNVESSADETLGFLNSVGFKPLLSQYELVYQP